MRKRWILLLGLALILTASLIQMEGEAAPKVDVNRDTLENQALLSGSAPAGTQISCMVYTYNIREKTTLLYQSETVVEDSGLYQLTVPLPVLGCQYVMLRVGEEETTYAYHRYRKQLADDLKGYYLNLYQVLDEDS